MSGIWPSAPPFFLFFGDTVFVGWSGSTSRKRSSGDGDSCWSWVMAAFISPATVLVVVRCSGDDFGGGLLLWRRFWWGFMAPAMILVGICSPAIVVLVVVRCSGDGFDGVGLLWLGFRGAAFVFGT
ncbi:hypothetical protein A2U01_0027638, partial [Trifolium medium]|nr:hypothetical protein [Trifolium medium]